MTPRWAAWSPIWLSSRAGVCDVHRHRVTLTCTALFCAATFLRGAQESQSGEPLQESGSRAGICDPDLEVAEH